MDCVNCKIRMRVEHTFRINGSAQTSRHTCPKCSRVCTSICFVVFEDPSKGQGAYSLSKKADVKGMERLKKTALAVF